MGRRDLGPLPQAGINEAGGILWLNPGAAGPRGFHLPVTLAFLWAEAGRPRAMIHPLPV